MSAVFPEYCRGGDALGSAAGPSKEATVVTKLRWGILGTSSMAEGVFVPAIHQSVDQSVVAVGSRDTRGAATWAAKNDVPSIRTYTQVLEADDVDMVYIALPGAVQADWTVQALLAGKPVLVEKPAALTEAKMQKVIEATEATGLHVWEAFTYRFHPQTEWLMAAAAKNGAETLIVDTEFHFRLDQHPTFRRDLSLGGGVTADLVGYPLSLGLLLADTGCVELVRERVTLGDGGVDIRSACEAMIGTKVHLIWDVSFEKWETPDTLVQVGKTGFIHLPNVYHPNSSQPPRVSGTISDFVDIDYSRSPMALLLSHVKAALLGQVAPRFAVGKQSLVLAATIEALRQRSIREMM